METALPTSLHLEVRQAGHVQQVLPYSPSISGGVFKVEVDEQHTNKVEADMLVEDESLMVEADEKLMNLEAPAGLVTSATRDMFQSHPTPVGSERVGELQSQVESGFVGMEQKVDFVGHAIRSDASDSMGPKRAQEDDEREHVQPEKAFDDLIRACGRDVTSPAQAETEVAGMLSGRIITGGMYDISDDDDDTNADNDLSSVTSWTPLLDLKLLGTLVAAAEPALQHAVGKRVVILLGKTGSGKSTLVQAIAGRKLQRRSYQSVYNGAVKEVFEAIEPLEGFCIGHDQQSQTKHISHYLRTSGGSNDPEDEEAVVYLDSAGYEDTAGMEVDIATSISIQQVAAVCRSLRFVVLVSCASFLECKGGAIRNLVKLVSTLVGAHQPEQFKQHQLAFTFLFSHPGILRNLVSSDADASDGAAVPWGPSAELQHARKTLHGLVVDTLNGTDKRDRIAGGILKWLEHCLKKGFPFVDVFHPELTDVSRLIRDNLELFAPLPDGSAAAIGATVGAAARDVVRCGITAANASAVAIELRRMLSALRMALQAGHPEQIGELAQALGYLRRHLELDSVREAHSEATELVNEAAWQAREDASRLINIGTVPDAGEFGEASARIVLHLLHSVRVLEGLGLGSAVDGERAAPDEMLAHVYQRLAQMSKALQGALKGGTERPDLQAHLRVLSKLLAWGAVECSWQHLAASAAVALDQYVAGVVARSTVGCPCDAAVMVDAMECVQEVHNVLPQLREVGITTNGVEAAWEGVAAQVEHVMKTDVETARAALQGEVNFEDVDWTGPRATLAIHRSEMQETVLHGERGAALSLDLAKLAVRIRVFVACVKRLEAFLDALDGAMVPTHLAVLARDSWHMVLMEANSELLREANPVKAAILEGGLEASLEMRMQRLRGWLDARTDRQQRDPMGQNIFTDACDLLMKTVQERVSQLDLLHREMMAGGGLGSPERHLPLLITLARFAWLDGFLPPGRGFVAEGLRAFAARYFEYFLATGIELLQGLTRFLENPAVCAAELEALKPKLSELEHLPRFCLPEAWVAFNNGVEQFIMQWCARQQLWLETAPEDLSELSDAQAAVVDAALATCEGLTQVQPRAADVQALCGKLHGIMQRYRTAVLELARAQGSYSTKQTVLDAIWKWEQQRSLFSLVKGLPSYNELCGALQTELSQEADAIRKQLGDTDNWEEVEARLEKFAMARVLDAHLKHQASRDLDYLTSMLEIKRARVDEEVQKNIEAFEFAGIRELLEPLAESQDNLSRQRFTRIMGLLASSVQAKISAAHAQIASGAEIVTAIALLKKARDELGKLGETLKQHTPSVALADQVQMLEACVAEHFQGLLSNLELAGSYPEVASSYPVLFVKLSSAKGYHADVAGLLNSHDKQRASAVISRAECSLKQLDRELKEYVDYSTSELQDRSASPRLFTALRSLKAAAHGPAQQVVKEHYHEVRARLRDQLSKVLIQIRDVAKEREIFTLAVEVFEHWKREWDKGLKEHVPQLGGVDLLQELKELRASDAKVMKEYGKYLMHHEQLARWVRQLNALRSESSRPVSALLHKLPFYTSEYDRLREKLQKRVSGMVEEARCHMAKHNYGPTGALGRALKCILQQLGSHLHDDADAEMVCTQIAQRLSQLAADLVLELGRNRIDETRVLFSRFHSLVLGLTLSHPGVKQRCAHLHGEMCCALEARVKRLESQLQDEFDFEAASASVSTLRGVGQFLSSELAVYCEDIGADLTDDREFQRVIALRNAHFGGERLAELGIHFAVLEVPPCTHEAGCKKAYHCKCMVYHPDRPGGSTAKQQQVERAKEALLSGDIRSRYPDELARLFTSRISQVPRMLKDRAAQLLDDQAYDRIKALLSGLADLHRLCELVTSPFDVDRVRQAVHEAVKEHARGIGASVRVSWERRELKKVHEAFGALAQMELQLSAFDDLWSDGWRQRIAQVAESVEKEIVALAGKTRGFLRSQAHAEENITNVAMQLIHLGYIVDDLPRFKDMAMLNLENVLDACQALPWGFHYLFQLGMGLERGIFGARDPSGEAVSSEDQRIGHVLVNTFRHFKDVVTLQWNEEVTQKSVDATLAEVTSKLMVGKTSPDSAQDITIGQARLRSGFETYEAEYDECFSMWRVGKLQLDEIAQKVVDKASKLRPCCVRQWSREVKAAVPGLLGGVFAYFTISKSGDSFTRLSDAALAGGPLALQSCSDRSGDEAPRSHSSVLLKPHNIQVLTILQLMGLGTDDPALVNQLMQIRTGEGKSIILGVCALLLGLLGLRVRCVCYSEYLSDRDRDLFQDLFYAFGVTGYVTYSKITAYSEDAVAAKGNLRNMTLELMHTPTATSSTNDSEGGCARTCDNPAGRRQIPSSACNASIQPLTRDPVKAENSSAGGSHCLARTVKTDVAPPSPGQGEEVLLVDEVDVFFGQNFYGKCHNQVACLEEPKVSAILRAIWELRGQAGRPREVLRAAQKLPAYLALLRQFPQWHFLLEKELACMCSDLKQFSTPAYHFDTTHNRIGYKEMDGINYDVVWGYRTAFAYLSEASKGTLRNPETTLAKALQLRVPCGQFSYASVTPALILGVSGTVEALGVHEWQILNQYAIHIYTRMPSVYGQSNFRFLDQSQTNPIIVEASKDAFFQAIIEEVRKVVAGGRAVITLFKDALWLEEFMQSNYSRRVATKNVLKESQSREEKEYIIKKAATVGQATFCTAVFGRGTDFFCVDRKLQEAGGMHVIQTFVSMEKSEEVQIQGRTARQGKQGTYAMVLLEDDLKENLAIERGEAKQHHPRELYTIIDEAREKQRAGVFAEMSEKLQEAMHKDRLTHAYFDSLLAKNMNQAREAFKVMYKAAHMHDDSSLKKCRMMCLSDATGSMGPIWDSTKEHIREMLRRIAEIGGDNLELMWVAYRDYSDIHLLRKSPWSRDANELDNFVQTIECKNELKSGEHFHSKSLPTVGT
eukprot:gene670-1123_t